MDAQPIYLDYQATTPPDPRVVKAMLPYFAEKFGNPHASRHAYGWRAEAAVDIAQEHCAALIGANPSEILFTSGATESNNLAIKGLAQAQREGERKQLISVVTEHKCLLESLEYAAREWGYQVTLLPVNRDGLIALDALEAALQTAPTLLVSVMAVNNEIGVIQPLKEIGELCRAYGAHFHCDAAQGFGKIPLDVEDLQIDLLSFSGHKVYGPMGVGGLYVRRRPRVRLVAQMSGGGQQKGLRSGTIPLPLVVGLGKAAEIAKAEWQQDWQHAHVLSQRFLVPLMASLPGLRLNGHPDRRFPGNVNLSFEGVQGESLLLSLKGLAVSSGAACASASAEPSYVLKAIGVPVSLAHTAIRFGFGRFTTDSEVDIAVKTVINAVETLQSKPLDAALG